MNYLDSFKPTNKRNDTNSLLNNYQTLQLSHTLNHSIIYCNITDSLNLKLKFPIYICSGACIL